MQLSQDQKWDAFYAEHREKPFVKDAEAAGFEIYNSGGWCSALLRKNPNGTYFMITCPDDSSIPCAEYPKAFVGHYTANSFEDGGEPDIKTHEFDNIGLFLEWLKIDGVA